MADVKETDRRRRQMKDVDKVRAILQRETVCHLSMVVQGEPYVVPMIYVYDANKNALVFHSALKGTKMDALRADNRVAFSVVDTDAGEIIDTDGKPCGYGIEFESVVGFGEIKIIEKYEEKIRGYDLISKKFKPKGAELKLEYRDDEVNSTCILSLEIQSMSGKAWDGVGAPYYF